LPLVQASKVAKGVPAVWLLIPFVSGSFSRFKYLAAAAETLSLQLICFRAPGILNLAACSFRERVSIRSRNDRRISNEERRTAATFESLARLRGGVNFHTCVRYEEINQGRESVRK